MTTLDFTRAAVGDAERAHAAAVARRDQARAALADAERALDEKPTKSARAEVVEARVDLESAERNVARRAEALEKMRATLAAEERRDLEVEFARERDQLARFDETVASIVDRVVDLDRDAHRLLEVAARLLDRHARRHQRAADHARQLGTDLAPRVTDDDLLLAVQRGIRDARAAEDRTDVSRWLTSASNDWRVANMSADELASATGFAEREADRLRVDARARDLAHQALSALASADSSDPRSRDLAEQARAWLAQITPL